MNIIIKSDEQRSREAHTLRDFGYDPRTAGTQERELAETVTRLSDEAAKEMEAAGR